MNPYIELVDRLRIRAERCGKQLPPAKIEALVLGLSHESPVVRRCGLELLDHAPIPCQFS